MMASRNLWIAVAIAVIVLILGSGVFYYKKMPGPTSGPTVALTLYEGDKLTPIGMQGLFGLTQSSLTSPGPQLNFTVGDVVSITVFNAGNSLSPHNWAIVDAKSDTAPVVFGAQVGSGSNPLSPGASASTKFTVNQAGNFYYVCQVPGHVELGMWGTVVVTAK
jgi:plastocyanin